MEKCSILFEVKIDGRNNINNIMAEIAQETNGKSFKTFKYSFDSVNMPSFHYDDYSDIICKQIGITNEKYKGDVLNPSLNLAAFSMPKFKTERKKTMARKTKSNSFPQEDTRVKEFLAYDSRLGTQIQCQSLYLWQ